MSYELMQKICVISDAWGFGDKTDTEALSEIKQILSEERQKGGEQGALHRVVGATVGADGGQRKCPKCGVKLRGSRIKRGYHMMKCEGTEAVCDTVATGEGQDSERTMKPSGSPPLGPQARSGEALSAEEFLTVFVVLREVLNESVQMGWSDEICVVNCVEYLAEKGYIISRTGDGERSEHRGPNTEVKNGA